MWSSKHFWQVTWLQQLHRIGEWAAYYPMMDRSGLIWKAHSEMVVTTNAGAVTGDEVVEAYLKTPQADGPRHSLVAFERVKLMPGASQQVTLKIDPRSLSENLNRVDYLRALDRLGGLFAAKRHDVIVAMAGATIMGAMATYDLATYPAPFITRLKTSSSVSVLSRMSRAT